MLARSSYDIAVWVVKRHSLCIMIFTAAGCRSGACVVFVVLDYERRFY